MPTSPCPYCGSIPPVENATRCDQCNGLFEPLSKKATQLAMGPWFIHDPSRPFMPGFNTSILRSQIAAGRVKPDTILRGPSTHQFWTRADQAPGVSRLLGICHACAATVAKNDQNCPSCQADLTLPEAINTLGLSYVEPEDRQQAQAEIDAQRIAAPPKPKQKPDSKPKDPRTGAPIVVDPDLLKPLDDPADEHEHAGEPEYDEHDAHSPPDSVDLDPGYDSTSAAIEELWHSDAPANTPRRRKRDKGPDPLVLGLGIMLIVLVAGGLIVLVTSSGKPTDDTNPAIVDATPDQPKRSASEVDRLRDLIKPRYQALVQADQEIPAQLVPRVRGMTTLIEQGDAYYQADQFDSAYERYEQVQSLVGPIEIAFAAWQEQQAQREAVAELRQRVRGLRVEAQKVDAAKWAEVAWNNAEFTWKQAEPLIAAGEYDKADQVLIEAEAMYQMTIGRASTAKSAADARDQLQAVIGDGLDETALRDAAPALFTEFTQLRKQGETQLAGGRFEDAESAFTEAAEALERAKKALEYARYAKFYASEAGFNAASVLVGVASGEGIDSDGLSQLKTSFDRLSLSPNPADSLEPGQTSDFNKVTQALVFEARDAIAERLGEPGRACYLAGFHMKVVDQTLATLALTDDQQKRVHQSLRIIEEQANAAGWDASRVGPAIDAVRTANRVADIGIPPIKARQAWERFRTPLTQRERSLQLMDPQDFQANPSDPELFPGLGS